MKNKRNVIDVIKDIEKTKEPDEAYKKFEEEKSILAEHYAKILPTGSKITQIPDLLTGDMKNVYNIPDINDENSPYRKELAKIEKKHKTAIDKHNDKLKKFQDFMEDESDFTPHMIDFELLEQNEQCTQEVMDRIFWMINEPKT